MSNALAHESSPYLRQHADNPVDWLPWGEQALRRARAEDKPILLSVGYAACHWCHVMAHESFEDVTTAALMNAHFVNVKVDREERPDIDAIYMRAVQALTGRGGWPMTVFLTPDGAPFYGGTYYPPEDRHGLPGFRRVLRSVHDAWRTRRTDVNSGASALLRLMDADGTVEPDVPASLDETLAQATATLRRVYDRRNGGFGGAPKFPPTMVLDALLRRWARTDDGALLDIVRHSWDRMTGGGLFDQVGGGFHRYTVDDAWLVPHFEKMLYDNALLVQLGAHLYLATGDDDIRATTLRTLGWLRREMTSPEGAWYASLDAESDGREGAFYVWSHHELTEVLGDDAELLLDYWGASPHGNFEGENILWTPLDIDAFAGRRSVARDVVCAAIERGRTALQARRDDRVRPARDGKVIASWNGLMLRAMAECARAFNCDRSRIDAVRAGDWLWSHLVVDGRARRCSADGRAPIAGVLEDHAALGLGFLALYQLTLDRVWLVRAREMSSACTRWFYDGGMYFDTASDAEALVTRPRETTDNALPSGTSMALELDLLLFAIDGSPDRRDRADRVIDRGRATAPSHPLAFGHLLGCLDLALHGAVTVAVVGDAGREALQRAASQLYVPALLICGGRDDGSEPLFVGKHAIGNRATAYVCRGFACDTPTTELSELVQQLRSAARS